MLKTIRAKDQARSEASTFRGPVPPEVAKVVTAVQFDPAGQNFLLTHPKTPPQSLPPPTIHRRTSNYEAGRRVASDPKHARAASVRIAVFTAPRPWTGLLQKGIAPVGASQHRTPGRFSPWLASAKRIPCAPVAQLDRASGFEPEGRGFESLPARHLRNARTP